MNGDDAASPGPWSRRIQRAILPIGVLLLTTWVLSTGYGWSLRSGSSSREERRTDSSVHRAR